MTTTYTPILQLALPIVGELNGTWGTVVNDNITSMIEQAIAGLATINTWTTASHTLTTANGTTDEARCAVLECSGAPGAAATVVCPAATKLYVIKNSVTGGYAVTLKTSGGTGISVPNGSTALLYCDGTNVVSGATYMATVSTTQVDILAQGDLRLQDTTGGEYVALQAPATLASSYTLTLPVDDGTSGQALITDGSGVLSWSTAASGDVYGPASATDNAVARFDLTTGKIIQNSVVTIADTTGNMAGVGTLSSGAITSSSLTSGRVPYAGTAGLIQDAAALTFDGTILSATRFAGALNGTVGATTASTGAFTTMSGTGQLTLTNASNYNLYASGAGANYMAGALNLGTINSSTNFSLSINGGLTKGATPQYLLVQPQIQSDATGATYLISTYGTTTAASFTSASLYHFGAVQGPIGAGSTVTNQYGYHVNANLTGATNNYGFYGNIASGTGRFNFYAAGTADNYMAGRLGIGFAPYNNLLLLLNGTVNSSSTSANVVLNTATSDTNTSATFTGFYTQLSTSTTALANLTYYAANQGTLSGTVSIQRGFQVTNTLIGAATNIGFNSDIPAGSGNFNFWAGGTAQNVFQGQTSIGGYIGSESLRATPVASAVNYVDAGGGTTGFGPTLGVGGSDTNINMRYYTKGTGGHVFYTGATSAVQFLIGDGAGAVNYIAATGNTTTNAPSLTMQGADTNISFNIAAKGTGSLNFFTGGGLFTTQFVVANTTSAVNYHQMTGSVTGSGVVYSAQGTDTNIDLVLTPKGTGVLRFGTLTANADAPITGYITIKDAGGTTRKLAIIA